LIRVADSAFFCPTQFLFDTLSQGDIHKTPRSPISFPDASANGRLKKIIPELTRPFYPAQSDVHGLNSFIHFAILVRQILTESSKQFRESVLSTSRETPRIFVHPIYIPSRFFRKPAKGCCPEEFHAFPPGSGG
jgi:hypothetical protein